MKLSICIPTYSRCDRLDMLLKQICPMVANCSFPQDVEVCVSDNCSADRTFQVLREISSEYGFVRCRKNPENLGAGRNIWAVALMAKGDYIYLTGDDDMFQERAINLMLAQTERNADLVLFNSHPTAYLQKDSFKASEVVALDSIESYLELLGLFHASFIGNLMFKREAFQRHCQIEDGVHLSAYPHLFPVFRTLRDGNCFFANHAITMPDDALRTWQKMQPTYTSIDMARIAKQEIIPFIEKSTGRMLRLQLARSLPRAIWRSLKRDVRLDTKNPFQSISLKNLWGIYT